MEKIFIIKECLILKDGTKSEIHVINAFKDEKEALKVASLCSHSYDLYDVVCFVESLSLF